jgi:hypothetical protein
LLFLKTIDERTILILIKIIWRWIINTNVLTQAYFIVRHSSMYFIFVAWFLDYCVTFMLLVPLFDWILTYVTLYIFFVLHCSGMVMKSIKSWLGSEMRLLST